MTRMPPPKFYIAPTLVKNETIFRATGGVLSISEVFDWGTKMLDQPEKHRQIGAGTLKGWSSHYHYHRFLPQKSRIFTLDSLWTTSFILQSKSNHHHSPLSSYPSLLHSSSISAEETFHVSPKYMSAKARSVDHQPRAPGSSQSASWADLQL